MIGLLSKVNIIDYSGALQGRCIKVLKPGLKAGTIGDLIAISIIRTTSATLQKGDVAKGIIVRTKRDGLKNWADNAVVLVKGDLSPIGTRVKGPISANISHPKLRSMAKSLV